MAAPDSCPHCGHVASAPDANGTCPQCGAPAAHDQPLVAALASDAKLPPIRGAGLPSEAERAEPRAGLNPYESPRLETEVIQDDLVFRPIDMSSAMGRAWTEVSGNLMTVCAVAVLMGVAGLVLLLGVGTAAHYEERFMSESLQLSPEAIRLVPGPLSFLFVVLLQTGMAAVFLHYSLRMLRRHNISVDQAFAIGPFLGRLLALFFIQRLIEELLKAGFLGMVHATWPEGAGSGQPGAMSIALVLLYAGASVWLYVVLMFAPCFIIDRQMDVLPAIAQSYHYAGGNAVTIIVTLLLAGFVGTLAAIFTCSASLLVLVPYFYMLTAVCYLLATGQLHKIPSATAPRAAPGPIGPPPTFKG